VVLASFLQEMVLLVCVVGGSGHTEKWRTEVRHWAQTGLAYCCNSKLTIDNWFASVSMAKTLVVSTT